MASLERMRFDKLPRLKPVGVCQSSLEDLEVIQSKIPGRVIKDYEADCNERCFGLDTYTFSLVRNEDVTGVSGTGVVAVGCDFSATICVLQWVGEIKSTFWYPNLNTVKAIHEHGGKTQIAIDDRPLFRGKT